ncbi:MAG: SAM-dependent methyltransferase [bacterium]
MTFTLDKVVPWGRSFHEYMAMFSLSEKDLGKRILACGDGPASFNCILTKRGGHVISTDPLYSLDADAIKSRIHETYETVLEQTRKNKNEFVWTHIPSVEELGRVRMKAMNYFLSDYTEGLAQKRYIKASLPNLPFGDREFDIALCSHFLFLYSDQFSADFHLTSIKELCRVAYQVRIFPLLELGSKKSRHLDGIVTLLTQDGYKVHIEKVSYEFQKGGNEMLRINAT